MLFSRRWLFLMELVALNQRVPGSSPVSPPAFASPTIFAFEACACSRNEEKSDEFSGCRALLDRLFSYWRPHS